MSIGTLEYPNRNLFQLRSIILQRRFSISELIILTALRKKFNSLTMNTNTGNCSSSIEREFWNFLVGGSAFNPENGGIALLIPKTYGFVVMVAVLSQLMLNWMTTQVLMNRDRDPYLANYPSWWPSLGCNKPDCDCYENKHRIMQNDHFLFLLLLIVGGLEMPVLCALAGFVYIIARVSFFSTVYCALGHPIRNFRGKTHIPYVICRCILMMATIKFTGGLCSCSW